MTIPDPTYVTAQEVKDETLITALGALEAQNIEKLIKVAEAQIDAYCCKQPHHPFDSNVDRVFPREQDYQVTGAAGGPLEYPDRPQIPLDVSLACLRQVEWLYTQWWSNSATDLPPSNRAVTSESIGGDGSWSGDYAKGGSDFAEASLCEQARGLLEGYRSRTAPLSLTRPSDVIPR